MNTPCFHCGEPIPKQIEIQSQLDQHTHSFCCYGCQAIAEFIRTENLSQYYTQRTKVALNPSTAELNSPVQSIELLKDPDIYPLYVHQEGELHQIQVSITGMTCAACAWLIEKHIGDLEGVASLHVNLSNSIATLIWNPSIIDITDINRQAVNIGYTLTPYLAGQEDTKRQQQRKQSIIRLGIAGVGMMQVMMSAVAMYAGDAQGMEDSYRLLLRWASFVFATPVVIYSAAPFFKAALRDLKTRHFTMDLPVSIGIGLAYISSVYALLTQSGHVYFDSVTMFTFFLLLGRFLEEVARHKSQPIQKYSDALISVKRVVDDKIVIYSKSKIKRGDVLEIAAGESFPADGLILYGDSNVDESSLTGEYLPVFRKVGDKVTAGTNNIDQTVRIKVTAIGAETRTAAIERLTQRALSEKPKIAFIADKVAHYFVMAVLAVSLLTYVGWLFIDPDNAYWIMVSVLVVTCPCALSLATPVALTTATNRLKQLGFFITRGHVMEALAKCQHVIFDKTGTLTYGKFDILSISSVDEKNTLEICAALEAESIHPIAMTFHPFYAFNASKVRNYSSLGVEGTINDIEYRLGNKAFIDDWCQNSTEANPSDRGLTLFLATKEHLIGTVILQDKLRKGTLTLLQRLKSQGKIITLLTGDTEQSSQQVLDPKLFDHYLTQQTPEQKWQQLSSFQQQQNTLMIGDGLNDVPSLAGANTSIAMGKSSDLAKLHADAILLNSDISTIHLALSMAKKCQRIIKQNLFWAALYNSIMLPAAVLGFVPPWAAAIGMAFSSLLVVLNATRLSK